MSKLQSQEVLDGLIKYTSILLLFGLSIFNITDQIVKGQSLIERSYLTFPFVILGVVGFFIKPKIFLSVILFIAGLYNLIIPSGGGDCSSAVWFFLSFECNKKDKLGIVIIVTTLISLPYRSLIYDYTIFQIFSLTLGYTIIYIIYYKYVYLKYKKKRVEISELTADENQLVTYLTYEDISQKEAGALMELKSNKANDMLKQVKDKLEVTTVYSVIRLVAEYNKSKSRKDNSKK